MSTRKLILTRTEAAELCGLTPSGFDVWVRKGIVPTAIKGTRRWSAVALENALTGKTTGPVGELDDFERWEAENAHAA